MGKVLMSGVVPPLTVPKAGIPISDLAVGTTVQMNVDGVPTDFIVVNQGIPANSSLYGQSCNGTWLLLKPIHATMAWDGDVNGNYAVSVPHNYLNETFLGLLDDNVQEIVATVTIPYYNASSVLSGNNGLSTKVFLLSAYEVGYTNSDNSYFPNDGAALNYFSGATATKRIAYYNGSATGWWTRSTGTTSIVGHFYTKANGSVAGVSAGSQGVRPCLVLPSDTPVKVTDNGVANLLI